MATDEKKQKRRELFTRLKSLSSAEKATKSASICTALANHELVQQAELICSFVALSSEPDLSLLWKQFPEKKWAFASFSDSETLCFRVVAHKNDLIEGDFGIHTPAPSCPQVPSKQIDLVLTPGVGFDPATGHRLGRGKGHYDRFFAGLAPGIAKLGICFATQLTKVITEPHDIPMCSLVTEDGVAKIAQGPPGA